MTELGNFLYFLDKEYICKNLTEQRKLVAH